MHQSTTPSLSRTIWPRSASRQFLTLPIVQTLFPETFGYSLSSEAVVMRQLRGWMGLWRRSLTRSHKRTHIVLFRFCWNGTTSALQPEEITSKGTRVSCVYCYVVSHWEKRNKEFLLSLVFELAGRQRMTVKRGIVMLVNPGVTNPGQNGNQQMFALCDRRVKNGV